MFDFLTSLGTAGVTALLSLWYPCAGPGFSGRVAELRLQDGSEYVVTQQWGDVFEPYNVGFYMKDPGGKWGWCYVDHEAARWIGAKLEYDPQKDEVLVWEDGELRAKLDRGKKEFALCYKGQATRWESAPQTAVNKPPF